MASPVFFSLITVFVLQLSNSYASVLVLPLTHSLSRAQFNTTPHLLKSTSAHSATRFQRHHQRARRQVSLPLNPGSDYTLSFTLGSQTVSLYMDTGSDVVWLPCHPFSCILCEGKYNPATIPYPYPLNLTSASPVTCKSRACSAVHSSLPSSHLCAIAKCPLEDIETSDCKKFKCPPFYYAYGDGSLVANLYTDSLSLSLSSPSLVLKEFTFGCAHSALGEPIGVAGFGRGTLSLPAQLASSSPDIGNHFSYCLVSHSFDTAKVSSNLVVPQMLLHFGGNSSVAMPRRNYFYEFVDAGDDGKTKRKVGCMMLMNGGDQEESGGPAGLLGNYQQQGFEVVYDLEKGRVGFARRKCASLWESLNQP